MNKDLDEVQSAGSDNSQKKDKKRLKKQKERRLRRNIEEDVEEAADDLDNDKTCKQLEAEIRAMEAQLASVSNTKKPKEEKKQPAAVTKKRDQKAGDKQRKEIGRADADEPDTTRKPTQLEKHFAQPKKGKKKMPAMTDEEADDLAKALIVRMAEAVDGDNRSNEAGRPALRKLMMLDEVTRDLRRLPIQEKFLDLNGCEKLAIWLERLPDGTFPNLSLVKELMATIDALDIDADSLQRSTLGRVIKMYASGSANMPQVMPLAKQIMDKWSRMVFGISTGYDPEGGHEQQYKRLRQKMHVNMEKVAEEDNDEQDEAGKGKKGDLAAKGEEITRGRAGIIMPARMAFDFIHKPTTGDFDGVRNTGISKGQEKLKSVLNNIKRTSKSNYTNRNFSMVKLDY